MKHKLTDAGVLDFLRTEYTRISDDIIIDTDTGAVMFNKYTVTRTEQGSRVHRRSDDTVLEFTLLRHAAAWCVLDKYNKVVEANRLYAQDGVIGALKFEEQQYLRLAAQADNWRHTLSLNKLTECRAKLAQARRETDKYLYQARIMYSKDNKYGTFRTSN